MKILKIKLLYYISLIVLLSLLFCSCIEKNIKKVYSKADSTNIITYNMSTVPENLGIAESKDVRQQDLLLMIFDGLVTCDESGNISGGIADSWKVSNNGLTYTFKIREDAYFSDGTSINAQDFVDFFSGLLRDNNSEYNEKLDIIFGVKEYRQGKREFKNVAIRAKDSKTLEIILNKKDDDFLNILSLPDFCLRKLDDNLCCWKKQYKNILYTGAYKIKKIAKDGTIVLEDNNRYFGWCKVKCKEIHITVHELSEAAMAAFDSDHIDIGVNPPKSEIDRLSRDDSIVNINNELLYKKSTIFGLYFTKYGNVKLDRAYKINPNKDS